MRIARNRRPIAGALEKVGLIECSTTGVRCTRQELLCGVSANSADAAAGLYVYGIAVCV